MPAAVAHFARYGQKAYFGGLRAVVTWLTFWALFVVYLIIYIVSEFSRFGGAREGDNVTDVEHTCDEENQALEAESEACMGA